MRLNYILVFSLVLITTESRAQEPIETENSADDREVLFIGTYTKKEGHVDGKAEGIYSIYRNKETGALQMGETVARMTNPSFVKVSPDKKNLYAVSELGENDAASGFIYSYKINQDFSLQQVGKISTGSFAPCHITIDKTGKFVFVSNYVGGVVMVYKRREDGSLERVQKVSLENSEGSNAHSVTISSDNQQAYVADLGNDKIWIFNLDQETGKLDLHPQAFVSLQNGSGPRHFTLSKNGKFSYSINEINSSVNVFSVSEEGGLKIIQSISSLPENFFEKNSAADIHLHPSGKFLYVSNRGHNSIASFKVNPKAGKLNLLEFTPTHGEVPRSFTISKDGKYLYVANQDSNSIVIFKIDAVTGKLTPHLDPLEVMTPVSIEFGE